MLQHALDYFKNVLWLHEADFHVNLRMLGLPVRAQVFISQATGNLKIAVETSYHKNLLVKLRALRQCVKHARINAARHDVITRSLWRRLHQNRRFDFNESLRCQVVSYSHIEFMPE